MKLSIITINLNNAEGLRKTIESVVFQTFTDYEYIIIDGASTDGSVDIIKQYADKITYWVSEPDKGIYNAMNKGILQAKGEYCLFLNSGDWLLDDSVLDNIFSVVFDDDIVYGNVIKISDNGQEVYKGCAELGISLYSLTVKRMVHQACLIKRELFTTFGLYSESYKIASDWKFFVDTIILGNVSVRHIDIIISCYDMKGISSVNAEKTHEEFIEILRLAIPPRILSDIQELDRYKHSSVVKLYDKLISNKSILRTYNFLFHGKSK